MGRVHEGSLPVFGQYSAISKVLDATVQLRATGYKTVVHMGLIVEIKGNPVGLRRTAGGGAGAMGSNAQTLTAMVDRCGAGAMAAEQERYV